MHRDMPGPGRLRRALSRVVPHLLRGLAYAGASAWMCAPVVDYLRGTDQEPDVEGDTDPDRVTPYAELREQDRRMFLELDAMVEAKDAP